jgi:hypothetical protein
MSEQNPIPNPAPEVKQETDKIECNVCKKFVTKKNISTHQKTALCRAANPNAPPLPPKPEKSEEPKAANGEGKIKQRFDNIDAKLDLLLEMISEMYEDQFDESDYEDEVEK